MLAAAQDGGLLNGNTVGVDATDLEANASLKSIVRRDSGDDKCECLRKLYEAEAGVAGEATGTLQARTAGPLSELASGPAFHDGRRTGYGAAGQRNFIENTGWRLPRPCSGTPRRT